MHRVVHHAYLHRLWCCLWHGKGWCGHCLHGCDAPRTGHEVHHPRGHGWYPGYLWPDHCRHHQYRWCVASNGITATAQIPPSQWARATHSTRAMPTWARGWRAALQAWLPAWPLASWVTQACGTRRCLCLCSSSPRLQGQCPAAQAVRRHDPDPDFCRSIGAVRPHRYAVLSNELMC